MVSRERGNHPKESAMLRSTPVRTSFLLVLGFMVSTRSADAQPRAKTYWTLEAHIAQSEGLVRGSIATVSRKVITAPGDLSDDGKLEFSGVFEYTITVKVEAVRIKSLT